MLSATRQKMKDAVSALLAFRQDAYGFQLIETDNWIDTELSNPDFPYPIARADVIDYYEEIADIIHAANYLHAPNYNFFAAHPDAADADITRVASKADLIWYEGGTAYSYLQSEANIAEWIRRSELVIGTGCRILLDPNASDSPPFSGDAGAINDAHFLAGLAMALGAANAFAGYSIFYPRDSFPWLNWPQQYGTPSGLLNQDSITLNRNYGANRLFANVPIRFVTWSPSQPPAVRAIVGDVARYVATVGDK
jgi:hypothetical protein